MLIINIKRIIMLTFLLLGLGLGGVAADDRPIQMHYNLQEISSDVNPIIVDGAILAPIRAVSKVSGFNVKWDSDLNAVTISSQDNTITITPDSNTVLVNGQAVELTDPARNINGHVMVPLRFIGECLGLGNFWDDQNKVINFYSNNDLDNVKIGLDLELTGAIKRYGLDGENGALLAVDYVNKNGGLLGKQVKIIALDNKSDNSQARDAANRLAEQGIVGYVGCMTSQKTLSAIPVATKYKLPIISPTANSPDITIDPQNGKVRDYAFRICFLDPYEGKVMAKFASHDFGFQKMIILFDESNDYSKELAAAFENAFTAAGGKVIEKDSYAEMDQDFKTVLAKIKDAKPDAVFIPGYYNEGGLIIKQAREMGITVPLLGGDGWGFPGLTEIAGSSNLTNVFFCNHFSTSIKNTDVQSFVNEYKEQYGTEPTTFSALGYDATLCLLDAIKRAGSTDTAKITRCLADTSNFNGITGPITMDMNHNPLKPGFVIGFDNGKEYVATTYSPVNGANQGKENDKTDPQNNPNLSEENDKTTANTDENTNQDTKLGHVFPKNENGQTYGSSADADSLETEPDLIAALGVDGTEGYVKRTDLEGEMPRTPEEAIASMNNNEASNGRQIPLYAADGKTVIGVFNVGGR